MSKDLGEKHKKEIDKVKKSLDSLVTVYRIMEGQQNEVKVLELQKQLKAQPTVSADE